MPSVRPTRRLRLLVITPRYPFPPIGGDKLRIHSLSCELAEHFDLTLASLCDDPRVEPALTTPPVPPYRLVYRVYLPRWRSWVSSAAALGSRLPLQVAYYRSAEFDALLRRLIPEHDVIVTHLIRLAPYGEDCGVPRVLEMTDAISMNMARAAEHPNLRSLRYWLYRIEARRTRRYERLVAERFDLVSLISRVDRDHVFPSAELACRVLVVPNGAHPAPQISIGTTANVVFIGNVRSLQNRDALRYFVNDILPAVRSVRPDVRLRVIGPVPAHEASRLRRCAGVDILGEVPSVSQALNGAALGVCPVRIGAGMQNKLLDYLAHGLPAITSAVGLEGLDAQPGRHLLLAESTQQWVDQVLRVLADRELSKRLGTAGRQLVRAQYSWSDCARPLVDGIFKLAAQAHAPGASAESLLRTPSPQRP
jgi:glycosyltransferase involved in cell wall biosynthesis